MTQWNRPHTCCRVLVFFEEVFESLNTREMTSKRKKSETWSFEIRFYVFYLDTLSTTARRFHWDSHGVSMPRFRHLTDWSHSRFRMESWHSISHSTMKPRLFSTVRRPLSPTATVDAKVRWERDDGLVGDLLYHSRRLIRTSIGVWKCEQWPNHEDVESPRLLNALTCRVSLWLISD
jgi:hypothetical protein